MKRALIFGATGGIGQAIAARLAESGWSMYLHCNSNWEEASDLARTLAEKHPLTTWVLYITMSLKAETENSTPRRGARERMAGANPPRAGREGTLERGQEMARRPPPLPGTKCVSARHEFRWNHGQFCSP